MKRIFLTSLLALISLMFALPSFGQKYVGQQYRKDKKLQKELEGFLEKRDFQGQVGIYALNLKNWKEATINADTLFPTASIVKVPIIVGVMKKVIDGELTFHQSLMYRDSMARGGSGIMQFFKDSTKVDLSLAVRLMMSHSDNTASVWCQELAGGGETINAWLKDHGYKDTRVNSRTPGRETAYDRYGWGQTTPREMAQLMVSIRKKNILTPAACERIYRDMTDTYWDDYAIAEIPPYVQVASKQGMVNASRSELIMVNAPNQDYVFYIATKNNEDVRWKPDNDAWQLARDVSKLLWEYYEPFSDWKAPEGYTRFWDWD